MKRNPNLHPGVVISNVISVLGSSAFLQIILADDGTTYNGSDTFGIDILINFLT